MPIKSLSAEMLDELEARGRILSQSGNLPVAMKLLEKAIELAPQQTGLHIALAEIFFEHGQFQKALDAIEQPEVSVEQTRAVLLKAYCLEKLQRFDEAEKVVDQILSFDGGCASALNLKGVLSFHRREISTAEHYFEQAIECDPADGRACINLGLLQLDNSNGRKALEMLQQGFERSPQLREVADTFHEIVGELKAFEEAEPLFQDACRRFPLNKRLAYLLIDVLIEQNKLRESLESIQTCMAVFGVDDGILAPALQIRSQLVLNTVDPEKSKSSATSLCMIVKNEEKNLARCLLSVKDLVDEIIIVDTGSTDRSQQIAEVFGARVYQHPWHDDFSEARNISLAHASGKWIFILDADEVIARQDHEALLQIIRNPDAPACAYSLMTRNYTDDVGTQGWQANDGHYSGEQAGSGWNPSEKVRLFPNDPRICFENPVHELVEPALRRAGIPIKKCPVAVHHYGMLNREKHLTKKKGYFSLGIKKRAAQKGSMAALIENAIQAQEIGEYEQALDLWQQVLKEKPDAAMAHFNMSFVLIELEKYKQGKQAASRAMELDPGLKEAVLNCALCQLRTGEIENVLEQLPVFLHETPGHPVATGLMAVAHCIRGRKDTGLRLFDALGAMGFNCPEYVLEHARKLLSAGRRQDAIQLLEAVSPSQHADGNLQTLLWELNRCMVESEPLRVCFLDLQDVHGGLESGLKLLEDYHDLDEQMFTPIDDVQKAQFVFFPYSIDGFYHELGLRAFTDFLRQLPGFAEYGHKFVFFLLDDISAALDLPSVIYRVNHDDRKKDLNSISLPYFIDDIFGKALSVPWDYHVNFVGTIVTHALRASMLLGFLDTEQLPIYKVLLDKLGHLLASRKDEQAYQLAVSETMAFARRIFPLTPSLQGIDYFIDISVDQYPWLPAEVKKEKKAQLISAMTRSATTLCPRGFGVQSIRFFETLSAGRIPLLISDHWALPMQNRIDYDSFVWKVAEDRTMNLPHEIAEFFSRHTGDELKEKAKRARKAWEDYLAPARRSRFIYLTLREVLEKNYCLNKTVS